MKLTEAVSFHVFETKFLLADMISCWTPIAQHRKPSPETITPFLHIIDGFTDTLKNIHHIHIAISLICQP